MTRRFGRRTLVRALGASALAFPLTKSLTSYGQDTVFPKRFVVFFTPNGTIPEEFAPSGSETDFTFRRILEPLERHKRNVLVLEGIDMRSAYSGPGDGHQTGMGHMLTGVELLPGDVGGGCDSCAPVSWASGISIDQLIANAIGANNRFRSLELGVKVGGGANVWTRMCYRAASEPLPPDDDPYRVFARVFGNLDLDPNGAARRRALKKSVLDAVSADLASVRARVGSDGRRLLDAHTNGVRELERRLDAPGGVGASCAIPTIGDRMDVNATENYPAVGRAQMDLLAMALACDLTRVASLQWTVSVGNISFPWLDISDRHHDLSHEGDGNLDARDKLIRINRWYAEQFAYLLDRLAEIPEGNGTLLDNTVVLWCNELGKGNSHTRDDIPFVLGGRGGGALRTGRHLKFGATRHNDLYVTLAQVFGLEIDRFGDPRFCTGPLSGLT